MTDPKMAPKTTPKAISTKQLAYALADQHQLTKRQGQEMLDDLTHLITKHLKKAI
jgi:DNA-binding protein HU-beta